MGPPRAAISCDVKDRKGLNVKTATLKFPLTMPGSHTHTFSHGPCPCQLRLTCKIQWLGQPKQQKFISHSSEGWDSKTKVLAG